jgi:hypothetical protein
MKLRTFLLLLTAVAPALAGSLSFQVSGPDPAPWGKIFGAIGIPASDANAPAVIEVYGPNANLNLAERSQDHVVIVQGWGAAAQNLGFRAKTETIAIRQIRDIHAPKLEIIWEHPASVPAMEAPADYQIFATERWKGLPVLAGKRTARGAILWLATDPGANGFERYPYLLQALADLGINPPLAATNLWAFFDSSYRLRADVDYLARRWRHSGIGALHVAAWHNIDPDPAQDEYLKKLIDACHRNSILVYAWLELPHVSEKFWADHPEWREKTALGQDAQLDWRKLMNLQNPECHRAAAQQISALLHKFDWDGVNLAELYFESLEGVSNPARFTPMNDDVRAEFKEIAGFDPKTLFDLPAANPTALRKFLDFRAVLASRLQSDWLAELDQIRKDKPYLDVVLTQIDDRFDSAIRDELGADTGRSIALIAAHKGTLLVEDPANLWNLGPDRYAKLAQKYREQSAKGAPDAATVLRGSVNVPAVDINVVERYQDVYPTKKQTGVELFELVHQAAESFSHVGLYFENSLEKQDLPLLAAAASSAKYSDHGPDEIDIQSSESTRVAWQGPVEVDGKSWPLEDRLFVLAPPGKHRISPGVEAPAITIADFNGVIQSANSSKDHVELSYSSRTRALATLGTPVSLIEVDGAPFWKPSAAGDSPAIVLPAGQHVVSFKK